MSFSLHGRKSRGQRLIPRRTNQRLLRWRCSCTMIGMQPSDKHLNRTSNYANGKSGTLPLVVVMSIILFAACGGTPPSPDPAAEEAARAAKAADEAQRRRDEDVARLTGRAGEIERRWKETTGKIANGAAAPSRGVRSEIDEDMDNVREAIANLATTSRENWWGRHEAALTRTVDDIAEDVSRVARKPLPPPPSREAAALADAPFQSRRDQFVERTRASVDGMERHLEGVRARGARETELKDTRARIDKLQDDLDTLRKAEADDWWDVSVSRVREYLDRLEDSVGRLNDAVQR